MRTGYRNGRLIYPVTVLDTTPHGSGGMQPGPDTVGTEEIIDGSIILDDMNPNTMAVSADIDDIL